MEASKPNLQGGLELEIQEELMFHYKVHQVGRADVAGEAQRQSAGESSPTQGRVGLFV